MQTKGYKDIDSYIAAFPVHVRELLETVRATIHNAAPESTEVISYQMPAFKQHGVLVYFAAYKNHIGFYPTSSGIVAFQHKFGDFKWSKGAVQFPIDKPLPLDLIADMVKFRLKDDQERESKKRKPKNSQ